jgi:hypothetical protein
MLIDGEKWACEACVRGHRVSNCQHHGELFSPSLPCQPPRRLCHQVAPRIRPVAAEGARPEPAKHTRRQPPWWGRGVQIHTPGVGKKSSPQCPQIQCGLHAQSPIPCRGVAGNKRELTRTQIGHSSTSTRRDGRFRNASIAGPCASRARRTPSATAARRRISACT